MNDLHTALIRPITIGIDADSYGIFGGYDFGQGHVEAFYGMTDIAEAFGLDVDVVDYGLSGSHAVMPDLGLFGSVICSDISIVTVDLHATAYSLGAAHDVDNGIGGNGSADGVTPDLCDIGAPSDITATGLTLGGSYDLAQFGGSLPMVLSAEYSRTSVDLSALGFPTDPAIDLFAIGLTIPIGNGSTNVLNSNTRTARGECRSALTSILLWWVQIEKFERKVSRAHRDH